MSTSQSFESLVTSGHALGVDSERALRLVLDMLPIPGLSGHEGEIAEFVTKRLRDAGVPASAIMTDDANRAAPSGATWAT